MPVSPAGKFHDFCAPCVRGKHLQRRKIHTGSALTLNRTCRCQGCMQGVVRLEDSASWHKKSQSFDRAYLQNVSRILHAQALHLEEYRHDLVRNAAVSY